MKPGTRVRMSKALKLEMRGKCAGPGRHVGHGPSWVSDPEMPDDGCAACSWQHVEEFGDCVGVVEGPTHPGCPEVDVRWKPSNLCYGYLPSKLEVVSCP